MKDVIGQLETLRRRSSTALLAQRLAFVLAWTAVALVLVVLLDYALRLPATFRFILEVLGLGTLAFFVARYVVPALRFRPTLTQIALRVEQTLPAVAGRLASSVEFAAAGTDRDNELAARSVRDTRARLAGESMKRALRLDRTWRGLGAVVGVLAVALALVLTDPAAARTGLTRAILPYGSAKWPARTGVMSLMEQVVPPSRVHPQGQALLLRAQVTKGPNDQRVHAHYRLEKEGSLEPWNEIVLTHQDRGVHERLIDTAADAVHISFSTADDRTTTEEIRLVPPPAVVRATLHVTPPPYVASRLGPIEQEMGSGFDDRSVSEAPALVGSDVEFRLELNKPLPVPLEPAAAGAGSEQRDSWLRTVFSWDDASLPDFAVDPQEPQRWTLRWRLQGTRSLGINLMDEHGLRNAEPINYRIDAIEDRLPTVTVMRPESDEPVLARALVPLAAEAQDDVAVGRIGLEAALLRRGETLDESAPPAPQWEESRPADAATAGVAADLDLSSFQLSEGDVVLVRGVAEDIFELDGVRHDTVRSPPRRLRVISALDFETQVRRQLGAVRQNAIRIEAMQAELQDDVIDKGVQIGMERAQAQIGERVADQGEAIDELERLLHTNRLEDEQLADLLRQSSDLLAFAGRAAGRAGEGIEERRAEGAPAAPREEPSELREPAEADRPIVEAQQEVRDELADLIELLDRDEDTWVVTRQLQTLLEEQSRLMGDTGRLNESTMGRERQELSDEERGALDAIAERQLDLAEKTPQVTKELRDRAEAMEEVDPESASGMRSAADTADQRELERDMRNAAERVNRNQLQNAGASQQQAMDTIRRMLEDIAESKQARTEQLLRRLASLLESISRLIVMQENEIVALAEARAEEDFTGRDRAMIRLNQNTQAVAVEARGTGQEARRVARALDRAADAQGAAVSALRAQPPGADEADAAESQSLELLKEAKALAEELQQQAEADQVRQRREELIEAYRAFAERQVAVRAEVMELGAAGELERRHLVEARRLATAQDDIGSGLDDLRRSTEEIMNAAVFSLVHDRIDGWSGEAAELLREGDVSVEVTDHQAMVAGAIGRLIDALEEALAPPPEFTGQQEGGGGGQAGQQPLIPPVAELRLLQGVQREIYEQTTGLDGRGDLDDARRRQRLRDLGEQQREILDIGEQMLERLKGSNPEGEAAPAPEVPEGQEN